MGQLPTKPFFLTLFYIPFISVFVSFLPFNLSTRHPSKLSAKALSTNEGGKKKPEANSSSSPDETS